MTDDVIARAAERVAQALVSARHPYIVRPGGVWEHDFNEANKLTKEYTAIAEPLLRESLAPLTDRLAALTEALSKAKTLLERTPCPHPEGMPGCAAYEKRKTWLDRRNSIVADARAMLKEGGTP